MRIRCSGDGPKIVIRLDLNSKNAAVRELLLVNQRLLFSRRTLLLALWSQHLSIRGDVALIQRQRDRNYLWDFFFLSKALLKCRYLPVFCICRWSHVFWATQPWQTEICLICLWGLLPFCHVFHWWHSVFCPRSFCHPPKRTCQAFCNSLNWSSTLFYPLSAVRIKLSFSLYLPR